MDKNTKQFCCYCGGKLSAQKDAPAIAYAAWCDACQITHYLNPTILVASFLYHKNKLLWTKRGIAPSKGKWAFPAGFAECGESLQQAAARELLEETGIDIAPGQLVPMSISSIVAIDQIYVVFRYECDSEIDAAITEETEDWQWCDRENAPWNNMAHEQSRDLVEQVYTALENQQFFMRVGRMDADKNRHESYALGDKL